MRGHSLCIEEIPIILLSAEPWSFTDGHQCANTSPNYKKQTQQEVIFHLMTSAGILQLEMVSVGVAKPSAAPMPGRHPLNLRCSYQRHMI